MQQQIKNEGWQLDPNNTEITNEPTDYEATSRPQTPTANNRRFSDHSRNNPSQPRREDEEDGLNRGRGRTGQDVNGSRNGTSTPVSDRGRSWGEGMNQIPPPYVSDDNYSRGSRSREDIRLEELSRRSTSSREGEQGSGKVLKLEDNGGKEPDVWVWERGPSSGAITRSKPRMSIVKITCKASVFPTSAFQVGHVLWNFCSGWGGGRYKGLVFSSLFAICFASYYKTFELGISSSDMKSLQNSLGICISPFLSFVSQILVTRKSRVSSKKTSFRASDVS